MHTVIETRTYLSDAQQAGMTEEERDLTVVYLAENPEAGDIMQGTGGPEGAHRKGRAWQEQRISRYHVLRRKRHSTVPADGVCKRAKSKSHQEPMQCLGKDDESAQDEFGQQSETAKGKQIMSKKNAFDKIAAGLTDAIAIAKGEADPATYRVHAPSDIDVLKIRTNMGLTREAFAMRFGLKLGTVRDWEQHKRRPEGAARVLLTVIEKEPEAVTRALAAVA